ncbi:MAG: helix-turn-helix domain-containing protein [Proteobacteria bacterium]|nr:helix-turn-helix domain-containing protein [Pseudomonadota bacterium]
MSQLSSVKKALRILEAFSLDQPELGVTEISRILKSHKSSVFRVLRTLVSTGFVEKNPQTNKYRLGLKLVELGNRILDHYDLRDHAGPFMEALAKKTKEIIHLSILDRNEIVYLDKRGEGQTLTVATKIGGRSPAHACAMGKVLLAGLSSEELSNVLALGPLAKLTPKTVTTIPKLLRELELVRSRGYAVDDEESFPGIRCVAAPLSDREGTTVAAISATVPKQRMGKKRMREMSQEIIETARLISRKIEGGG